MPRITEDHVITSIADALQYISYYHPPDFIRAMASAWKVEKSPAARNAMAQILANSRMAASMHAPTNSACCVLGFKSRYLRKW